MYFPVFPSNPPEPEPDEFRELQSHMDRAQWQGVGCTSELPADGTWAGGNADNDGDEDPIERMHAKSRVVGPKGIVPGANR